MKAALCLNGQLTFGPGYVSLSNSLSFLIQLHASILSHERTFCNLMHLPLGNVSGCSTCVPLRSHSKQIIALLQVYTLQMLGDDYNLSHLSIIC